jgi:DNA polymerase IIIc chi subunit
MEALNWTEIYAWILIGCGVWSVMIGSMLVYCWHDNKSVFIEDITEEEAQAIENEVWQYEQDQLYLQENGH